MNQTLVTINLAFYTTIIKLKYFQQCKAKNPSVPGLLLLTIEENFTSFRVILLQKKSWTAI